MCNWRPECSNGPWPAGIQTHSSHTFVSLGQATDIVDQLPDLIVRQSGERHHAGSWRSVLDDPEQLAIGNVLHHRAASEVSRWGNQCRSHKTLAVALLAMTHGTGDRLCSLEKQCFPRLDGPLGGR